MSFRIESINNLVPGCPNRTLIENVERKNKTGPYSHWKVYKYNGIMD